MYTVQDATVPKIVGLAEALGVEPGRLITDAEQLPQGRRISCARLFALYDAAAQLSGDPAFGVRVGESSPLETFGAAGAQVVGCATLGEAAAAIVRVMPLLADGITLDLQLKGPVARLRYQTRPGLVPSRHAAEATLAILVGGLRSLGWHQALRRVEVAFARPRRTDAHDRAFGVPVLFGSDANALGLDRSALDAPLLGLSGLRTEGEQDLRIVPDTPPATVTELAYDALAERLTQRTGTGLRTVAAAIGVSTRTLQRRLREEGTSHDDVLDRVRRDVALQLLERRLGTIDEVAWQLGYAEPSPFYRAFKRWTGRTPRRL